MCVPLSRNVVWLPFHFLTASFDLLPDNTFTSHRLPVSWPNPFAASAKGMAGCVLDNRHPLMRDVDVAGGRQHQGIPAHSQVPASPACQRPLLHAVRPPTSNWDGFLCIEISRHNELNIVQEPCPSHHLPHPDSLSSISMLSALRA